MNINKMAIFVFKLLPNTDMEILLIFLAIKSENPCNAVNSQRPSITAEKYLFPFSYSQLNK